MRAFLLLSFALLAALSTSSAAQGQKGDKPSRKTVAVLIFVPTLAIRMPGAVTVPTPVRLMFPLVVVIVGPPAAR